MSWTATIVAVAVAVVATAIALWSFSRQRRAELIGRERELMASGTGAALAASGMGLVIWPHGVLGGLDATPRVTSGLGRLFGLTGGRTPSFDDIYGCLARGSAAALEEAVHRLRDGGVAFEVTLHDRNNQPAWTAVGLRATLAAGEADLICFREIREEAASAGAMRAEIARVRGMLDALPVPVWSRNAQLQVDDCNLAYARAVEAETAAEALRDGREIAGSGTRTPARALADRVRATGAVQSARRHVVIGGARRLFQLSEEPLDGSGRLAGFALDLTPVEDAEGELRRHVAAHGEVLQQLSTAIVIFGPDRRVKFFNHAYADLWSFDESWLEGGPEMGELLEAMRERRLLPETADFPAFKRERIKLFTSLIEPMEELVHLPDGATLRQVTTPHPMGGLLQTFEDVTDRLALERSYNTLIDVQRETLDNLAEGVAVFGGDGRLKLSNPVFAEIWDLPPDFLRTEPHVGEVLEAARNLFFADSDWPDAKRATIEMVTGRVERTGRLERADGAHIEYGMIPLPDGGMLARYLDVTDSTRVERALRERTEALEAADQLKSEFIANVSYELRTPLNTIIGFTEILDNEYFGPLNERQKEYSQGILDASQRLLSLINDILELASIEAGRVVLQVEPLDVRSLLDDIARAAGDWAREREITIAVECPAGVGTISGDERRLKHALLNMVGNAIKFTRPGGDIKLSARRTPSEVVLSVTDDGIGIAEEEREKVFEKFFRGKDPDGRQDGVGLGLSLVKSVIELHGGNVTIESEAGAGTTVSVHLPLDVHIEDDRPTVPVPGRRASA